MKDFLVLVFMLGFIGVLLAALTWPLWASLAALKYVLS